MFTIYRFLLITFLLSALNSCAFMPDNDYASEEIINPTKIRAIKTVGLLKVATPSKYWMGKPEPSPLLINPALDVMMATHEHSDIFVRLQYPDNQTQSMKSALIAAGYEVTVVDYPRETPSKLVDDYSNLKNIKANAILDIGPAYVGYMVEPFGDILSPTVFLHYRLISTDDIEPIFDSNAFYSTSILTDNWGFDGWSHTAIKGPNEHMYSSKDELKSDLDEGVRRMQFGIDEISKHIASRIKQAGDSNR